MLDVVTHKPHIKIALTKQYIIIIIDANCHIKPLKHDIASYELSLLCVRGKRFLYSSLKGNFSQDINFYI